MNGWMNGWMDTEGVESSILLEIIIITLLIIILIIIITYILNILNIIIIMSADRDVQSLRQLRGHALPEEGRQHQGGLVPIPTRWVGGLVGDVRS